jgi:hypothetical protein
MQKIKRAYAKAVSDPAPDIEPKLAIQTTDGHRIALPKAPVLDKEDYAKAMERKTAPKVSEPEGVTFMGSGVVLMSVFVDHPAKPGEKIKKNFDVDFGTLYQYTARHPELIKALREKGYKEKGK